MNTKNGMGLIFEKANSFDKDKWHIIKGEFMNLCTRSWQMFAITKVKNSGSGYSLEITRIYRQIPTLEQM